MRESDAARRMTADRPAIPAYGIAPADGGGGLYPWTWAESRLTTARNYWLTSVRPDGRPHTMPIWGVWIDGGFAFSTSPGSRKARNLVANGACTVTVEAGEAQIVVEGIAGLSANASRQERAAAAYSMKYNWTFPDDWADPWYFVTPYTIFGFSSAEGEFTQTATRWRFRDE